jgi:hypothetical protein
MSTIPRDIGDDPIDELSGELTHAPAATRRAEAAAFTAEGHDHVVSTAVAAHVQIRADGAVSCLTA